ncbi:hypothetical protein U9M48_033772, partial [Paspalum notatum var. saurae]
CKPHTPSSLPALLIIHTYTSALSHPPGLLSQPLPFQQLLAQRPPKRVVVRERGDREGGRAEAIDAVVIVEGRSAQARLAQETRGGESEGKSSMELAAARRRGALLALGALLLALAGAARAWPEPPHHGLGAGGAGRGVGAAGERWYRDLAQRRMESVRSSFGARRDLATASPAARVFHVTDYGADPTGATDATAAINKAIADAFRPPTNATMTGGIPDLGGAEVHLDGGTYLVKAPLTLPASGGGNFKIHGGTLRASPDFPTDRYLIELSASSSGRSYDYEYATLRDLMLDCAYRGGGVSVVNSLRVAVDNCYVAHFATDGVAVRGGHETFVRNSFLGQHMTAGGDPGERGFTGTAIRLDGNDNTVSDVVIFSAATGILVTAPANSISGVHCYNKAAGFGGTGIYLKSSQAWISNCYMDYTSIVAEDPVLLHVSGSFFLGDANVVLKAVDGVARGVQVVGNIFSGRDKGVDIVQLDGSFATVDQVYVQHNSATGMTLKSTSARTAAQGNGTTWTIDFSSVLLFPDRIGHVQYSLVSGDQFPGHTLRNVSGNQVVVATDKDVAATVHVLVDQNSN